MSNQSTEPVRKNYFVDTNVLIDSPESIVHLRNGVENGVYIPHYVMLELNKLKKEPRIAGMVSRAMDAIEQNAKKINFLKMIDTPARDFPASLKDELVDDIILREILDEIKASNVPEPRLVSNDRIFRRIATTNGLTAEPFRDSRPFKSESETYTGIINVDAGEDIVRNCFSWKEGKPCFHAANGECTVLDFQHDAWKVKPKTEYQNMALHLMLHNKIDFVTMQSSAGYGKTFLALAAAFKLAYEKKQYKKVIVAKPYVEMGRSMGFLPGDEQEKMAPYIRNIRDLVLKLHQIRPANKIFIDPNDPALEFNPRRFEVLPLAYIRGMNIDNAVVIIDEIQNLHREETRALLTRMGQNVKVFALGDTNQVDNRFLDKFNNGLNWIVRLAKGQKNYAHIVLKGAHSRGPITDMVLRIGL